MPETVILLTEAVDRAIDHENTEVQDWDFIYSYIRTDWITRCMGSIERWPCIGGFFKRQLFQKFSFNYDVIVNMVEGHELAQNLLRETIPECP